MASRSDGVTRLYEAPQAPEPERLPQPTKTKDKCCLTSAACSTCRFSR